MSINKRLSATFALLPVVASMLLCGVANANTVLIQKLDTDFAIDGNNDTGQEGEQVYL